MFADDMTARIVEQLQLLKQVLIWEIMNSLCFSPNPNINKSKVKTKKSFPFPTGPQDICQYSFLANARNEFDMMRGVMESMFPQTSLDIPSRYFLRAKLRATTIC